MGPLPCCLSRSSNLKSRKPPHIPYPNRKKSHNPLKVRILRRWEMPKTRKSHPHPPPHPPPSRVGGGVLHPGSHAARHLGSPDAKTPLFLRIGLKKLECFAKSPQFS
jgi:hypothetical protein